jgi:hypothetical protein
MIMSYTSVYELYKTKVNCITELRNGHGSGPAIWDYISLKLYGEKFNMFDDKKFWPSYKDTRLDEDERAVLLSTYDSAFVEVEHLEKFASACKRVHTLITETTRWEWSHFEAIGLTAKSLYEKHDHRCLGLAIGCTSVCDIWEQESPEDIDYWGVYHQMEEMQKQTA